eukprot:TRINITY_DN1245_c0_g1_i42.p1 TRINITY_DN1245_c0_g1~~TRINITY_DN1245_c0_g1_i42.p1  ORF type:complete len:288 (+),score=67.68 TRINITY_DN1245_c0_g1_i42:95-958(+)
MCIRDRNIILETDFSFDELRNSKIYNTVTDITKLKPVGTDDVQIKELANKVVRKWKSDVLKKGKAPPPAEKKENAEDVNGAAETKGDEPPEYKDPIRKKTYEWIANAFKKRLAKSDDHSLKEIYSEEIEVYQVARSVEEALYAFHTKGGASMSQSKYKEHSKELILNLQSERNDELWKSVLNYMLRPEDLVSLPYEELASTDQKQKIKKLMEEDEKLRDMDSAKKTLYKNFRSNDSCPKCKQHKVMVNAKQTRRGDEGMTGYAILRFYLQFRFFTCIECGNCWKRGL